MIIPTPKYTQSVAIIDVHYNIPNWVEVYTHYEDLEFVQLFFNTVVAPCCTYA